VPIAGFPFGVCVRTELDWLVNAGIFEMERIKRERIEQAFQKETQQVYPAASYFWTKQDSLLPNNAIFELTESGDFIVMHANCGGVAFAVADLPPEALKNERDVTVTNKNDFSKRRITIASNRSALRFVNIRGRLYRSTPSGVMLNGAALILGFDGRTGMVKRRLVLR
jgi:hypothetical protein